MPPKKSLPPPRKTPDPPITPSRLTRAQAQQQQQNLQQQATQSHADQQAQQQLIAGIRSLQLIPPGPSDQMIVQSPQDFRNWALPPSDHLAVQRLTELFETYLAAKDYHEYLALHLENMFRSDHRFLRLAAHNSNLHMLFQRVQVVAGRSRDTQSLMDGARATTRKELGEEFMKAYEDNMGSNKTQWDATRRVCNEARKRGIPFLDFWRCAWYQALHRIRDTKRGGSKVRAISNSDINDAITNAEKHSVTDRAITAKLLPPSAQPNVPDAWLDRNNIPWLQGPPPPELLSGNENPGLKVLPWGSSTKRKPPPRTITPKPKNPHPSDRPDNKPGAENDPFYGSPKGSPKMKSVKVITQTHTKTGATRKVEIFDPAGTPARSIAHLAAGWKEHQPIVVPTVPVAKPKFQEWYPDMSRLTKLEDALLQFHQEFTRFLAGERTTAPDPRTNPVLAKASEWEIRECLLGIRRKVAFTMPSDSQNPYTMPENAQYYWTLSLGQWLMGIAFWDYTLEQAWVRTARNTLVAIRQAYPPDSSNLPRRLHLTQFTEMLTSSFEDDAWLIDAAGRFQGWANDDLVQGAIRYYARDRPDIEVIAPAAYTIWQRRILGEVDDPVVAPIIPRTAQQVYIPINVRNTHWVLGRIDIRNRVYGILDSLGGGDNDPTILRQLLLENGHDPNTFTTSSFSSVQQSNFNDCGYWVIANARNLIEVGMPAPNMTTADLRLGILMDLYRAIQQYNPLHHNQADIILHSTRQDRRVQFRENLERAIILFPKSFKQKSTSVPKQVIELSSKNVLDADDIAAFESTLKKILNSVARNKASGKMYPIENFDLSTMATQRDLKRLEEEKDAKRTSMRDIEETKSDSGNVTSDLSELISEVEENLSPKRQKPNPKGDDDKGKGA